MKKFVEINYDYFFIKNCKKFMILDLLKFIFACVVVYMHTSPLHKVQIHLNFIIITGLGKIIVPFFFTCSGFFLFRKTNISLFMKYVKRIMVLYFVWNLIYHFIQYFLLNELFDLKEFIFSFFYTTSPLWYVDALIKSIIILFFLSKFFNWIKLTLFFFIITFFIYSPLNFYINRIPFFTEFYKNIEILEYLRLSSIFFVSLGALFGNVDLKKIYNGKRSTFMLFAFFILMIFEVVLFKYIALLNNDLHHRPTHFFALPFLMFFLFYRSITFEPTFSFKNNLLRKYSSIIYFSHYCFIMIYRDYLLKDFKKTALLDIGIFSAVLLSAVCFSFFLVQLEKYRIRKITNYLY